MAIATAPVSLPEDRVPAAELRLVGSTRAERDQTQRAAEHTMLRGVVIGTVIGVVLGAVVWAALVVFSLMSLGGVALAGPAWMGAAVGVFAGSFLGGWAGVVATTSTLERAERAQRK